MFFRSAETKNIRRIAQAVERALLHPDIVTAMCAHRNITAISN